MSREESDDLVVVTGATGAVGRLVVAGLLAAGRSVRAVSRRPHRASLPQGAEVVFGDLDAPSTLAAAFDGARQLVLIAVPDTVEDVVTRARLAGVEHVVVVSSAAVTAGYDTTYHAIVEQAVRASGLAWTIVRPGEFATNALLIWGPSIRADRRVVEPFPDQIGHPLHEADIADVVLADLVDPHRRGRVDTIIGPDVLTKREQVAAIADAIGERIALDDVSPEQARSFYQAQGGFAAANADFLFGFESYDGVEGAADEPHATSAPDDAAYRTLAQVTGAPARTYRQWARDHSADFT
ncbi:NAD(P)H-binding protein [Streptomyces sp. DSM 44915]|uniref:NAD(P)H-binding protein n=1 Tax=Streptomyces chisholmiae TaxID=3075540 RepID=A0ABU2JQP7_9ACTN|nr:NAD(P)H-binding protein [Streptomyces sp. DSM 44915]MDT0267312.1 NAD(P)H-binding protein [Streptomyces sp. DSM 44915]